MAILNDKNDLQPRKLPQQKRSMQMRRDILLAAVRLLSRDGPLFSMSQVATAAGISVGSLYQYFANREALLFAVQLDEWDKRMAEMKDLLADREVSPAACLKKVVTTFFQGELQELYLNKRIGQQGIAFFKSQPEFLEVRIGTRRLLADFLQRVRPDLPAGRRVFLADFMMMTFTEVGEKTAGREDAATIIEAWGTACAEMLCRYVGLQGVEEEFTVQHLHAMGDHI